MGLRFSEAEMGLSVWRTFIGPLSEGDKPFDKLRAELVEAPSLRSFSVDKMFAYSFLWHAQEAKFLIFSFIPIPIRGLEFNSNVLDIAVFFVPFFVFPSHFKNVNSFSFPATIFLIVILQTCKINIGKF